MAGGRDGGGGRIVVAVLSIFVMVIKLKVKVAVDNFRKISIVKGKFGRCLERRSSFALGIWSTY
jgi:hypothetical protein